MRFLFALVIPLFLFISGCNSPNTCRQTLVEKYGTTEVYSVNGTEFIVRSTTGGVYHIGITIFRRDCLTSFETQIFP
jgi:hypothetical protein